MIYQSLAISSQRPKCANSAQAGANAYETVRNRRVKFRNFQTITGPCLTLSHRLGKVSYSESDLLHWMASYRSCPESGVIHSTLNFGSGQTRMNINLF